MRARSDLPRSLGDVAQGEEAAGESGAADPNAAGVELALSELVGDANGEVVIFNDSGLRSLAIRTGAAVLADGQAGKHVTAGGDDVSGFKYITFDNGVTLYYPEGLDLVLERDRSGAALPSGG